MITHDPVCRMQIDSQTAAAQFSYEGQTYYFCTVYCKKKFELDPPRYVQKDGTSREKEK